MNDQAQTELPKYQSHKQVWALLKIEKAVWNPNESIDLFFSEDSNVDPINIEGDDALRFKPSTDESIGDLGYYVVYKDGYRSWSPTDAFEEGYTHIDAKNIGSVEEEMEDRPGVYTLKGFNESGDQAIAFYEMLEDGSKLDGTTLEEMLRVTNERLAELNSRFPSDYNEKAMAAINEAIHQLNERTRDRVARGVEGEHKA